MKQVIVRGGGVEVENVSAPITEKGTLLVEVHRSCISVGTEMSGVKTSSMPLWKRAMKQPENVKKVLETVAQQGVSRTASLVKGKLSAGNATGYSAAGVVIEVGEGVDGFTIGDRVACAGAQCAHHAEIIRVPSNLSVKIPENVSFDEASTVTLGAIALQGVRRASPTLGESFVVVGLGVLGQLTVQLLKANGCNAIGIDLSDSRVTKSLENGLDVGVYDIKGSHVEQVKRVTDGHGADGVIITAASSSDEIISTAFNMTRKKGRVVLVGDVGLHLNRADFYAKEIDFFISCSYGPGRYDNQYEEKGLDYPLPYVRWTENRNMLQYLSLISKKSININSLISKIYEFENAPQAYSDLKSSSAENLFVLLDYGKKNITSEKLRYKITNELASKSLKQSVLNVALVGAGGFAKGMHLPNLQSRSDLFNLKAIVSRTGHNAMATAKQFGAQYSSTSYEEILQDNSVDTVILTTRHDLHGKMVLAGLKAGKHVLVEKPLTINQSELLEIKEYFESNKNTPILLTGYNRRFSPHIQKMLPIVRGRSNPMIINYIMNAGKLPADHWTLDKNVGGGRNLGEACHIYDLFTYLIGEEYADTTVHKIHPNTSYYSSNDNFVASFTFKDGSIATLTYTSLGSKDFAKETMQIFVDGLVIELDDFKRTQGYGTKLLFTTQSPEKGQLQEVISLAESVKNSGNWPIPIWEQFQVSQMAFDVEQELS